VTWANVGECRWAVQPVPSLGAPVVLGRSRPEWTYGLVPARSPVSWRVRRGADQSQAVDQPVRV